MNGGAHNTGWIGEYKGVPMLFAEGDGTAIALAASVPWVARSAGFVGVSDGWQDVCRNFSLTDCHERAEDGNVALTGELDLRAATGPVVLALGFGRYWSEAAYRAKASLSDGFDTALTEYMDNWRTWQRDLRKLDRMVNGHNIYRIGTSILRAHDSPSFPGGIIASLSIPWGFSKGDDDLGGYHLIWPRDLAETGGGLIACGAVDDARRVLGYLRTIQEANGGWPQNTWLDGLPYWRGIQMDECAFPILLVDLARRNGVLGDTELAGMIDMVRRAAGFVVRNGPCTAQDRWEENAGFSPFTLAVEVAALLAAAELLERDGAREESVLLRDTADAWNDQIESWTYATGTPLATASGVAGYYVRIAPRAGVHTPVAVKNRALASSEIMADEMVSPDALALVRFGLRAADDPRIRDTLRVIDRLLRIEFPVGPCWRRYNGDGYGEHEDGSAFDGTGIGRAWPLLTGERAHYALAAGDIPQAQRLMATMERLTSRGGLIPEQIWDSEDVPGRELFRGQPSGSAMPLVWAHAEHVKLCRSLADGTVFDMPPQTVQRYQVDRVTPRCAVWRPDQTVAAIRAGRVLRVDLPNSATLRWSTDRWASFADTPTSDNFLGLHAAEIPTAALQPGACIAFTWRESPSGTWAGENHEIKIID